MNGSDKQVEWAEQIQNRALVEAAAMFEAMLAKTPAAQVEVGNFVAKRTLELLEMEERAAWWIETVNGSPIKTWIAGPYKQALAEYTAQQPKGA